MNLANFDERAMNVQYIEQLKRAPDVIVLGSSRTMPIAETMFPSRTFFNHSMSGAILSDFLLILSAYRTRGFMPKTIIMGLDPGMLNAQAGFGYSRYAREVDTMLSVLGRGDLRLIQRGDHRLSRGELRMLRGWFNDVERRTTYLMSPTTTMTAWKHRNELQIEETTLREGEGFIKAYDGSISRERSTRERSLEAIAQNAQAFVQRPGFDNSMRIDPQLADVFARMFRYLQVQQIEVIIVLLPYHPITYDGLMQNELTGIIDETQRSWSRLAKEYKHYFVGSYDPKRTAAAASDFIDGWHVTDVYLKRFLQSAGVAQMVQGAP